MGEERSSDPIGNSLCSQRKPIPQQQHPGKRTHRQELPRQERFSHSQDQAIQEGCTQK